MNEPSEFLSELPLPPLPKNKVCYGRVKDLEAMVPSNWWQKVFGDALYLKTDGDVVEDPEITQKEIQVLEEYDDILQLFRKGQSGKNNSTLDCSIRILDLCCGQGRHSIHLSEKYPKLQIFGHDQSTFLINIAKERARKIGSGCVFTTGDCRCIPYDDQSFDMVMLMGNSFGYFCDDKDNQQVLNEAYRVLKPGGFVLIDLADGDYMRQNYSTHSWEWIDDETFVVRERQLSKDSRRLSSREVITDVDKGVIRDQFYQERLYSGLEMNLLLGSTSFVSRTEKQSDVDVITVANELSKRGEDLGMMGHRMLIRGYRPLK